MELKTTEPSLTMLLVRFFADRLELDGSESVELEDLLYDWKQEIKEEMLQDLNDRYELSYRRT